jgi:RNA polymerase sigma-70 factor (ECF subfamily)
LLHRWIHLGCQDAAAQLYHRYAGRLRALARSRCSRLLAGQLDPDDLVQSIFRRFYERVCHGDYDVPEGEDLWPLFLVIGLNRIRTAERFYRAEKRDRRITCGEIALDRVLAEQGQPQDEHVFFEIAVAELLQRLSPRQRIVAEYRLAGCQVAEIAARINRSMRTVERLLQECRIRLEGFLDDPE